MDVTEKTLISPALLADLEEVLRNPYDPGERLDYGMWTSEEMGGGGGDLLAAGSRGPATRETVWTNRTTHEPSTRRCFPRACRGND